MTAQLEAVGGLGTTFGPWVDKGYRAALLWTNSALDAEAVVAQAAAEAVRLAVAGALRATLPLVFLQLLIVACIDRARLPAPPRAGGGSDVAALSAALSRLGVKSRAALILHLTCDLPEADIAEVLGVPARVARAILHLGHLELEQAGIA